MKKHTIRAVHDQDLEGLLVTLGIYETIKKGKFKCSVCGEVITTDNLLCLYPSGQEVKGCCKKQECYATVLRESREWEQK